MTGRYGDDAAERRVPEPAKAGSIGRSAFQRDRARVLHSAAFRRLAGKTQVVGVGEDDFPRTRLTHSLECAQIGRELAGALGADPDVVDAACLAHDLGHPPYGHNGETALDAAAGACGGFEGNAQSLRILSRLEAKVDGAGLNLTRAVLDAATKYPWLRDPVSTKYGVYADDVPVFGWLRVGAPDGRACVEAQIMDWSDDVAYSVHDLEDGVHAGSIPLDRLDADAVVALGGGAPGLADLLADLRRQPWWPASYDGSYAAQVGLKRMSSALIGRFSAAAVVATRTAYGGEPLARYGGSVVVPEETRAECELLKAVTAHYVMTRRAAAQERQRALLTSLVAVLAERAPGALEPALQPVWRCAEDDAARLRVVIDQVASLTDASAAAWHHRLLGAARPGGIVARVRGPEAAQTRIERVDVEIVRPLRHAVLRPGWPAEASVQPTDDEATHFAAYDPAGGLVGVATVFAERYPDTGEPAWRLRGMAVAPAARGGGYGGALLEAALRHATGRDGGLMWCNARVTALGFYARYGFTVASEVFDVPGGGPHRRLRRALP